jgi:hypothetical protein
MRKLLTLLKRARQVTRESGPRPGGPKDRALMTESDWIRLRAPVRQRDEVLSDAAHAWVQRLAVDLQPHNLCACFPRIANQLARLWHDAGLIDHLLDDLTAPRRPGRRGFPPEVFGELMALKVRNDERLYALEHGDVLDQDAAT